MPDQSAMMLTQGEWRDLAIICARWLDDGRRPPATMAQLDLCHRIIEAA